MRNSWKILCIASSILLSGADAITQVKEIKGKKNSGEAVLGTPGITHVAINRLSTHISQDGRFENRLFYPKGSGCPAIWGSGLMLGAQIASGGEIRLGGSHMYWTGLQPGKVLPGPVAEDPDGPDVRVYRVRRDIRPGERSADVQDEIYELEGTADAIYDQYHKDWQEWRWQDGAPFEDKDGDDIYDPAIDVPGVPGADQTVWFVANDLDVFTTQSAWFSDPFGIEMQVTTWGYDRDDAFGNVIFRRFILVNKSSVPFDSMYVAIIVDPDLGGNADDLVGCDTVRSLGFVYNGYEYDGYYTPRNLPPPAVGFDFFQGPVVPGTSSDTAIFMGSLVPGKKNLPMSAFFPFMYPAPSAEYEDPPYTQPTKVPEYYNLMKGLTKYGTPWIDPNGVESKFPFSGDPYEGTGWLDGDVFVPSDRRFGLSSGPFTMAPGDTQEIVVGLIAAGAVQGVDRLTAVALLKYYDDFAQQAYDNFFDMPTAPPCPVVTRIPLDRQIILSWGDDQNAVQQTESFNEKGYAFQGYNVYQLPTQYSDLSEGKKLATFDIADEVKKIRDRVFDPNSGELIVQVSQYGTDSGIRRHIQLTKDSFKDNRPLANGSPYYYCVTSYAYNPDLLATPRALENPVSVITVVPKMPDPGVRYESQFGDTVRNVTHTTASGLAPSDGKVLPEVIDPTRTSRRDL